MELCAVQFKARPTVQEGLSDLRELLLRAEGCRLIVAPECALTGYAMQSRADADPLAEVPTGPTFQMVSGVARRLGAWIVVGFIERGAGVFHNSAMVVRPDGALEQVVRKGMLFEADVGWASEGREARRWFDVDGYRVGVGICMDLNDDVLLAWCARERLDVLAFPTNWEQEEGEVWDYWQMRLQQGWDPAWGVSRTLAGRASVEAVLVAADSYGAEGRYMIRGQSAVLTRRGVLAGTGRSGDALVRHRLDPLGLRDPTLGVRSG